MNHASIAHDHRMSVAVQVPTTTALAPEVNPQCIDFKAKMAVEDTPAIFAYLQRTK